MKENRTAYSYLIEHMPEPSFLKVWDIAFDFVRKLPSDLCDELHESLNRGVDVLDSEPLLQMYIYAFGKMHSAKLQYAFEHMQKNAFKYHEIEIVDYGCGQGLATMCYHDFLQENNTKQIVKRITLIEPSSMALSRAELLCSRFYPDAEIIAINKQFDELTNDDLILSSNIPTVHLLSNILDVVSYDLHHFSQIVKEQSVGDNEYIIVSPMQNASRMQRLKDFVSAIEKNVYFEQYLDKRQLDCEREWTCAVLLCSQSNVIGYDCDEVFEDAKEIAGDNKNVSDEINKSELFHKLQVCSWYGNKRCQNMLGIWYEKGIGTKRNYELALEWYKKSAEQDYASAYGNIGDLYCYGEGVSQDLRKAVDYYTIGANLNSADCLYNLACCYFSGEGVKEDKVKALNLFEKASSLGNLQAKYELYRCYINGWGTEKDEKLAIQFLKETAKLKHPESCYILAKYFHTGKLVKKSDQKAFCLIKESAELGYCIAQEKLGKIYKQGILGKKESPKRSFKWYYKAAEQNNASAQFYIGYFYASGYGIKKDDVEAFNWYCRAAAQNDAAALNNIAICYEYGRGTDIDLEKAVLSYTKSAQLGNTIAQKNLANCYKNGTGVTPDKEKVFFWTMKAAQNSDRESRLKVALYHLKGEGTLRSDEEALLWYGRYCSHDERSHDISNVYDAFQYFIKKGNEGDVNALYIIGKCYQYGVAAEKDTEKAMSFFVQAAQLGHIESLIKTRQISSLNNFCTKEKFTETIKDAYGVTYSKDKKILISSGYFKTDEYKIAAGTRVICDGAFHSASIKKIVIPSSVLAIGCNPFVECGWGRCDIKQIDCLSYNYYILNSALFTRNNKRLISYFGTDEKFLVPLGVEVIGAYAFAENEKLRELNFSDGLVSIEAHAFENCLNLKSVSLPETVANIGRECFYGCEALTKVLSLGKIKMIPEKAFMGCDLTEIKLPNNLVEIGENAFNSNYKLKAMELPDTVERIDAEAFAYCNLNTIHLSKYLQKIGDFCFYNCPLKKVTIPSNVREIGINPFIGATHIESESCHYIADNGLLREVESCAVIAHFADEEIALFPPIKSVRPFAFYNSNVTNIFMGANIVELSQWAFYKAEKLTSIIWKKCSIKDIPVGCFGECSNIEVIDIPVSVENVHTGAFLDCYGIKRINILNKNTNINQKIFERMERSISLPTRCRSRHQLMGSTIYDHIIRKNIDYNSFEEIEVSIPNGCSGLFTFYYIYDDDPDNRHENHGYGMDRKFVVKENENN